MTAAEPQTRKSTCANRPKETTPSLFFAPPKAVSESGKKLKVALLGYRSHPYVGGQGIYLKYLSAALADMGHDVHVFSGPPYPELRDDVALHHVASLDLYASPNHIKALRWRHLLSFSDTVEWWTMLTGGFGEPYTFGRRIAKKLRDNDFDIIHDNQCLAYGMLSLQKHTPLVTTIHHPIHVDRHAAIAQARDWKYRLFAKRWYSFVTMQEKVTRKLRYVTTVSQQSKDDIETHYGIRNRVKVIPNGVDTQLFCPQPAIKRDSFLLLTTASADQPLKGLNVLLDALHLLTQQLPAIRLLIIGRLKPGGDTENHINKLKLRDHIEFESGISEQALVAYYAKTTLAICPALYEGFGLPALEALACGTPLISSDGGALPEVVGDAACVVPAGDSIALAEAIADLLHHPEKATRLGKLGRARACSIFSWTKVAERLTDFYVEIKAKEDRNKTD